MSSFVLNLSNSTSNSSYDENIGGFPFILSYLNIFVPYSLILIIAIIVGVVGNVLIIVAVLISKELRTNPTCILITNLAVSDLLINIIVNSSTVLGVFLGKRFFDRFMALCIFFGASCLVACGTSLITMGFLAFNRYLCIFYHKKYDIFFSFKLTLVYCFLTWILATLLDVPNFIDGVGAHVYDAKTLSCLFDRLKVIYTMSFSIGCIIIPCLLIGYLYLRIFMHAFSIRSKVNDADKTKQNRKKVEAIRLAKSLFASFFIFSACWVPLSIIYLIGREDQLPMPAHTFTNLSAHLNSAINPIFYGIFNPKIRNGYINVFNILFCKKISYFKTKEINLKNYRENNNTSLHLNTVNNSLNNSINN